MIEMEKQKVTVRLLGKDYSLVTDQDKDTVQRIARYADRKMRETALVSRLPDSAVAVLTCMTLTEELMSAQEENRKLKAELLKKQTESDGAVQQTILDGKDD